MEKTKNSYLTKLYSLLNLLTAGNKVKVQYMYIILEIVTTHFTVTLSILQPFN